MHSRKGANTNYSVFRMTRSKLAPTIYHTQGGNANHYTTDVVSIGRSMGTKRKPLNNSKSSPFKIPVVKLFFVLLLNFLIPQITVFIFINFKFKMLCQNFHNGQSLVKILRFWVCRDHFGPRHRAKI